MKEATGELSTTVITVVAIAAVLTIFTAILLPSLRNSIKAKTYCSAAAYCDPCQAGENKHTCYYYAETANGTTDYTQTQSVTCSCDSGTQTN